MGGSKVGHISLGVGCRCVALWCDVGVLRCVVMWVCGHCEWMFMCVNMCACVSISVYTFFEVRAEQSSLVGQGVWPWGRSLHCSAVPCPGSKGGGD